MKKIFLILLSGILCGCLNKKPTSFEQFKKADLDGMEYSITTKDLEGYNQQMSEYYSYEDISDEKDAPFYEYVEKRQDICKAAKELLNNILSDENFTAVDNETNEDQLLMILKLENGTLFYIYGDGCLKVVDDNSKRYLYKGNEDVKRSFEEIGDSIDQFAELHSSYQDEDE